MTDMQSLKSKAIRNVGASKINSATSLKIEKIVFDLCFPKHLGYVGACRVGFEEVSCVVFCSCSAASADFAVLADPAPALYVALVSQLRVPVGLLSVVPRCFQPFILHVSEPVIFVEAA